MENMEAQPGGSNEAATTIHLPPYLTGYTDTRPLPKPDGERMYAVSEIAQKFIMEHSNLEEISEILQEKYSQGPAEIYRNCVVRASLSSSVRKYETPYRRFAFDSPENEALAKTLLSNPNLKSQEDLQAFVKFQQKHNLKLCSIPLGECATHVDAMEFINMQRRKENIDGRPTFYDSKLEWFVKRREYERQDIITDVFITTLTPQDFEKISNFRRFCEKRMEELKLSEDKYEMFARQQLKHFQNKPGALFNQSYLVVDPLYNLISNVMTDDQLKYVAQNIKIFLQNTNAKRILKRGNDSVSRENFFELFCSRDIYERRLPPFHELFLEKDIENQLIINWLNAQDNINNSHQNSTSNESEDPGPNGKVQADKSPEVHQNVPESSSSNDRDDNEIQQKINQKTPDVKEPETSQRKLRGRSVSLHGVTQKRASNLKESRKTNNLRSTGNVLHRRNESSPPANPAVQIIESPEETSHRNLRGRSVSRSVVAPRRSKLPLLSPENTEVHTTKTPKMNQNDPAALKIKNEKLTPKNDTESSDVVCIGTQHSFVISISDSDDENEKLVDSETEANENEFLQRINQLTPPTNEPGTSPRKLRGGRSVPRSDVTQRKSKPAKSESSPAPKNESKTTDILPSTSRSSPAPKNEKSKTYELRSAEKRKLKMRNINEGRRKPKLRKIDYVDDSD